MTNLEKIVSDLEKVTAGSEVTQKNVKLLQDCIGLYFDKTEVDVTLGLVSDYTTKNNIDLQLDDEIYNGENVSQFFDILKEKLVDKFDDFVDESLVALLQALACDSEDRIYDFLFIPEKFVNILETEAYNASVTFAVKNIKHIVSFDEIYDYIKSDTKSQSVIVQKAPHIYYKASAISKYKKNFINFMKGQNYEVDFRNYTQDEDILRHANDLQFIHQASLTYEIEDYARIENENISQLINQLKNNFTQTRNMALAALVVNQSNYKISEFDDIITQIKNF